MIWAELPGDVDTMKLFDEAITAGVSFAPGRIFSASDRYSTCMRLSCGYPWSPLREQAIVKLGQLVKNDVKLRTVQMRKRSGSTSLAPPAISFDRFAPR